MTGRFGEKEDVALWRVQGTLTREQVLDLGEDIAQLIKMTIVGAARVDSFPTAAGTGGAGFQAYWCWTESFLVISTWPELGFFRVYLASCREFLPVIVTKFLEATTGPVLQFDYAGF